MYRSAIRNALKESITWIGVLCLGFLSVFYFQEIRQFFSIAPNAPQYAEAQQPSFEPSDEQSSTSEGFERRVYLRAARNGHFFAKAYINGRPINVMVDTGATRVALTYEDAQRIGLNMQPQDYTQKSRTANGIARTAPVTLRKVRIGDISVSNIRASVGEPGRLHITLLGMAFLRELKEVGIRGQELVLTQ